MFEKQFPLLRKMFICLLTEATDLVTYDIQYVMEVKHSLDMYDSSVLIKDPEPSPIFCGRFFPSGRDIQNMIYRFKLSMNR